MSRARAIAAATITIAGAAAIVVVVVALTRSRAQPPRAGADLHPGALTFHGDAYRYLLDVPAAVAPGHPAPLLVVLHGCQTTAAQQAAVSGYGQVARKRGWLVLYPEVDRADVANGGCWRGIWSPESEGRGRGDAGAIAAITAALMRRWPIDPSRVYVVGISAGAYETSMLGAIYPDRFAAIGIHSGAAYDDGLACVGVDGRRPLATGVLARRALRAMGSRAGVMPVIVIHGDQDPTVPYRCGRQALAQWLATDNLVAARRHLRAIPLTPTATTAASVAGGHAYTVATYRSGGCAVAELWTVHGMGHAWSGGTSASALARYSDPQGPSAAVASSDFFAGWRQAGDTRRCTR